MYSRHCGLKPYWIRMLTLPLTMDVVDICHSLFTQQYLRITKTICDHVHLIVHEYAGEWNEVESGFYLIHNLFSLRCKSLIGCLQRSCYLDEIKIKCPQIYNFHSHFIPQKRFQSFSW